jgi:hypothetical protein
MKEKTKALLLQDYAQTHHISHKELKSMSGGNASEGLRGSFESAIDFIDSKPGSESDGAESAISNTRSTYKALATTLSNHIGTQQEVIQRQRDIIEGEQGRRHEAALSVAEDLIRRQQNRERQYQDQLALRDYDMMQQEQMHQQQLQNTRQQASALIAGIYDQGIHRMIGGPISGSSSSGLIGVPIAGSSSSSALPPMRLAIQDVPAENYKIHTESEEEEPIVAPGKLQPREEDVKHLFQSKRNRATKLDSMSSTGLNEKIYRKDFQNWMNENQRVLMQQIKLRPGILAGISQTEINRYKKDKLVSLLMAYDKKNPSK